MRWITTALLLALSLPLSAQGPITATWTNATRNTNGTTIPATGAGSLVRTVVEYGTRNGTGFGTKVGEVFVAAPAQTLQISAVVVQEYALRAFHCNTYATTFAVNANGCSGFSNIAFVVVPPPTPEAPAGLTVSSTRIGAAEWTCRDLAGNILSSHTRQDKAEEACINRALAAANTPYDVVPSGYRWMAKRF